MFDIRFLWKQKLSRTLIVDYDLGSQQQGSADKEKKRTSFSAFHFPFAFQSKNLR